MVSVSEQLSGLSGQVISGGWQLGPANARSFPQTLVGPGTELFVATLSRLTSAPWDTAIPLTGLQAAAPDGTDNPQVLSLFLPMLRPEPLLEELDLSLSGTGVGPLTDFSPLAGCTMIMF